MFISDSLKKDIEFKSFIEVKENEQVIKPI